MVGLLQRSKKFFLILGGGIGVLVFLGLIHRYLILDWSGRPMCHKQVTSSFLQVRMEANSPAFPNVNGASRASLEAIRTCMNDQMDWAENYNYIPGLQDDDPPSLVLYYFKQPTRWIWHGPPPTRFQPKRWIIVPINQSPPLTASAGVAYGELSESVPLDEFNRRIRGTLDFVRTNRRPHWEAIVAEHEAFLKSIGPKAE